MSRTRRTPKRMRKFAATARVLHMLRDRRNDADLPDRDDDFNEELCYAGDDQ